MQTGEIIVWKPLANGARHTFYKVALWTKNYQIERMLFAGTSLD